MKGQVDKRSVMDEEADKPNSKKQKMTVTPAKEDETPYNLYIAKLKQYTKDHEEILYPMPIKGISTEDGDDYESDEEETDTANYTTEQMESVRYILITKKRKDKLDKMNEFILQDQAERSIKMFDTAFSYHVRASFTQMKLKRNSMRNWSDKFDLLFAYTETISMYDCWMHDNDGDMNDMVAGLGRLWKSTLKKSNEELGIDPEYTRPGILELLKGFKEQITAVHACPKFKFNY